MSFAPIGSPAAPKVVSAFFEKAASAGQANRIAEIEAEGLPYDGPDAKSILNINGSEIFLNAVAGPTPKARMFNAIKLVAATLQAAGMDEHSARELAVLLCQKSFIETDQALVTTAVPEGIQLDFARRHVNVVVRGKSALVHRMSEWRERPVNAQVEDPEGKPALTIDSGISVYLEKGKDGKPMMTVRPDFWLHATDDAAVDQAMREPKGQVTWWERFVNLLADVVGRAGFRFETATRLERSQRELLQQYRGIDAFAPSRRNLVAMDLGAGAEQSYALGPLAGLDDADLQPIYAGVVKEPNPGPEQLSDLIRAKATKLVSMYERALRHEDAETLRSVLAAHTRPVEVALNGRSPVALLVALMIEANDVRADKYSGARGNPENRRQTGKQMAIAIQNGAPIQDKVGADDGMRKMSDHFSAYRALQSASGLGSLVSRMMRQTSAVLGKFNDLGVVRRLARTGLAAREACEFLQRPPVSGLGQQVLPVGGQNWPVQHAGKPVLTEVDDAAMMFMMGMSADEVKQQFKEKKIFA